MKQAERAESNAARHHITNHDIPIGFLFRSAKAFGADLMAVSASHSEIQSRLVIRPFDQANAVYACLLHLRIGRRSETKRDGCVAS